MKRYLAALAIGGAVFGTVLASAADLGTVTDGKLGSATGVVAPCQTTPISADYRVAWDGTATDPTNRYEVTHVELNGITDACENKRMRIALVTGTAGTKVAETVAAGVLVDHDGTAGSGKQVVAVEGSPSALDVTGIRVTIYGDGE